MGLAAALTAAACGPKPPAEPDHSAATLPGSTTTTAPAAPGSGSVYAPQATLQLGLDGSTTNWNVLARHPLPVAPDSAPAVVAQAVWPSAYVVRPDGTATRDPELVRSAVETSTSPQTIDYRLDPRATWSDGTPITGADFVYTWRAQSGQVRFRDKGGAPFTPASRSGYDRIASVRTAPSDPDRVVVTFKRPDPDWQALFSPILPAHVAEQVGFDHGFTDPVTSLVSGGPFVVQSYRPGQGLLLVRNPRWWGPAANLASISISFVPSAAAAAPGLQLGQLDAAVTGLAPGEGPLPRPAPVETTVTGTAAYDDLVANERSGPLRSLALRRAVFLAVDRQAVTAAAGRAGDSAAAPVGNRAFFPGRPGYTDDAAGFAPAGGDVPRARAVLAAAGYRRRGGRLWSGGRPVVLTLGIATDTPFAAAETAAVRRAGAALGITLTVVPAAPAAEWARVASGRYDLAVVGAEVPPFPTALAATYGTGAPADVTGYASGAMDALLGRLDSLAPGAARTAAALKVDRLAWADAVDLPLVAQPTVVSVQPRYANLAPDPWGIGWDAAAWGIPERT